MMDGKAQEVPRGDVVGVENAAALIEEAVRLQTPPEERGTPWTEEIRPCEAEGDEDHANPQHCRMRSWK